MEVTATMDEKLIKTQMTASNKQDALEQLAKLLKNENYISDIKGFLADVYKREEVGVTGIGNYIAIPHGKSSYVNEAGVAIGILSEEIEWETMDGKGVKGIILFGVGDDNESAQSHLKMLSLFARKLGNDEVTEAMLNAESSEDVIQAFK